MQQQNSLLDHLKTRGAKVGTEGSFKQVEHFGDFAAEWRALAEGPALVYRAERALLEITGKDRAGWLHNLTTNQIKNLGVGDGVYAFALNLQGRILFDLNVLVRPESFWVDLDRRFLETATKHFGKYTITEDVRIADPSESFVRMGIAGANMPALAAALGVSNVPAMPSLGQSRIEWRGESMPLFRHDFCGLPAVELFVPAGIAAEIWDSLTDAGRHPRGTPVGDAAVQVRRIEAGIPWPGHEITDEYLPAETRQLERAVSYQKGCYLGQEVVERMRSRQVVARQLVGLRIDGDEVPPLKSQILDPEGKPTGMVTSACRSLLLGSVLALGYVKTAQAAPGTPLRVAVGEKVVAAIVAKVPFVVTHEG